jgi:hypothetical protein
VDWIQLAPYRDQWQKLVNMVMILQVPYSKGNLPGYGFISSQEELRSGEVVEIMNILLKTIMLQLHICLEIEV